MSGPITKLYIVGNGFDLAHGIRSAYRDFEQFVASKDHGLHDVISTYFDPDFFWSDLEAALAYLDVDTLIDHASDFLVSYGAEDWSDSYHHDYQYEIEQVVSRLSRTLKARFTEWVRHLRMPPSGSVGLYNIDRSATFLNFNYTPSLTALYDIPAGQILHIHNSAVDRDTSLILGHAWERPDRFSTLSADQLGEMDTRVLEGEQLIARYFEETFKPTEKIIQDHWDFFESLNAVGSIYVAGHSMSRVDLGYFHAIVQNISVNEVAWTVSYYSPESIPKYEEALAELGIPRRLMQFKKLDEF